MEYSHLAQGNRWPPNRKLQQLQGHLRGALCEEQFAQSSMDYELWGITGRCVRKGYTDRAGNRWRPNRKRPRPNGKGRGRDGHSMCRSPLWRVGIRSHNSAQHVPGVPARGCGAAPLKRTHDQVNARLNSQRKILETLWVMWKKGPVGSMVTPATYAP